MIIFLGVFLFVYAYLPLDVRLYFIDTSLNKETFFYIILGLFLLINLLFTILILLYKNIDLTSQSARKQNLITWVTTLPVMLNLYLTFMVGYIGILNNASNFQGNNYGYLNYLGPILLIGWISALIFIFFQRDQITSESTN